RRAQLRVLGTFTQRLVLAEQFKTLAQLGIEGRDFRQQGIVGLAPFRHVVYAMQVADHAPGTAHAFAGVDHGLHEVGPGRRCFGLKQLLDQLTILVQQAPDGWLDMFGLEHIELRQTGKIEEGIGACGHGYGPVAYLKMKRAIGMRWPLWLTWGHLVNFSSASRYLALVRAITSAGILGPGAILFQSS